MFWLKTFSLKKAKFNPFEIALSDTIIVSLIDEEEDKV